jgi:hypothetical protein
MWGWGGSIMRIRDNIPATSRFSLAKCDVREQSMQKGKAVWPSTSGRCPGRPVGELGIAV